MSALARTVLIWLLVLSLPAQGLVAAGMVSCDPNHAATGLAAAALHATTADLARPAPDQAQARYPSRHEHGASTHAGAGHDGGHAHAASAEATPASDFSASAAVSNLAQADDHQCSACASCCPAAAACSSGLRVAAPAVTATAFIAVVPAVEKFAADGLDRPPRANLV